MYRIHILVYISTIVQWNLSMTRKVLSKKHMHRSSHINVSLCCKCNSFQTILYELRGAKTSNNCIIHQAIVACPAEQRSLATVKLYFFMDDWKRYVRWLELRYNMWYQNQQIDSYYVTDTVSIDCVAGDRRFADAVSIHLWRFCVKISIIPPPSAVRADVSSVCGDDKGGISSRILKYVAATMLPRIDYEKCCSKRSIKLNINMRESVRWQGLVTHFTFRQRSLYDDTSEYEQSISTSQQLYWKITGFIENIDKNVIYWTVINTGCDSQIGHNAVWFLLCRVVFCSFFHTNRAFYIWYTSPYNCHYELLFIQENAHFVLFERNYILVSRRTVRALYQCQ